MQIDGQNPYHTGVSISHALNELNNSNLKLKSVDNDARYFPPLCVG